MKIDRPLDMLNQLKGKIVIVQLKHPVFKQDDGNQNYLIGRLIAFDIHLNLVIKENDSVETFIAGSDLLLVKEED